MKPNEIEEYALPHAPLAMPPQVLEHPRRRLLRTKLQIRLRRLLRRHGRSGSATSSVRMLTASATR